MPAASGAGASRYPSVAGTLIHNPVSAAVPTALCTGSPHSVIVGTLNVPPPMPIIAETAPIAAGIAAPATPPGTDLRSTRSSSGSSILTAAASATMPNTVASTRASACAAASEPASDPTTIGSAQRRINAKSTEPRRACERVDDIEVGMMVAIEVVTARCSDVVGGTSIGAVMAAMVATDLPPERIEAVARQAFLRSPTGDFSLLPLVSLIKGQRLRRIVSETVAASVGTGAGLEDLWKPCFAIATNISDPGELVLRQGNLVEALLTSTAIPGALPPLIRDGDLLCDGGTFNNFPVDVMRRMRGVGTVIGVDLAGARPRRIEFERMPGPWALLLDRLRPRASRRYRLPSLPALLLNATILYSMSRRHQNRQLTDLYFNPPLLRVGMLDWKRFDSVLRQGYEHARQVLGALPADPQGEQVPDRGAAHQDEQAGAPPRRAAAP